jgi:hypothetical protein
MDKMMEDGGLATDGMGVDPVSGNDIPTGSNAEDVRDDVDAKLSSGEYVVPADVVKYLGVAQLEKLVDKAKMGLEDMAENGRIGGAPVAEPEEVVMTLGTDLEALDTYAKGGMVPGADVNGILDRVKAAAVKDPSVSNLLKSKGIFIQAPEQGRAAVAPAVEGQATPQKFAEGGAVGGDFAEYNTSGSYGSSFNPNSFRPGFSVTSTPAPTGELCPTGYRYDTNKKECVPLSSEETEEVDTGIEEEEQGEASGAPENDPNSWMEQYDYTDPDVLVSQTMTTLGQGTSEGTEEKTGLEGLLSKGLEGLMGRMGGGLLGKLAASGNYSSAMANAAVLESQGYTEQANSIRTAANSYAEGKGVRVGGFLDGTKGKSERAVGLMKDSFGGKKATSSSNSSTRPSGGGGGSRGVSATNTGGQSDNTNSSTRSTPQSTATVSPGGFTSARSAVSNAGSVSRDTAAGLSGAQMTAGSEVGANEDGSDYVGPMAKGGLVQPRKKTAAKKANKKTTNKKGLGRR